MKKIRIAQIGTSTYSHGNDIWNTLKKQTDIFDIAGYVFPEGERSKFPERMRDFAGHKELSLEEMLRDESIEAVAVETEEFYLAKYASLALKHGKHIHMEKPGGKSLAEFEELIKAAKKSGRVFHVGYMYRYNPEIKKLLEEIKNGGLGEIISVNAEMNSLHTDNLRAWLGGFNGGIMFFLGCHLIDLALLIRGEPDNIIAVNKRSGLGGINSEDSGVALLEYPSGVSILKTSSVEVGGFPKRHLTVSGTKKTVEIKPLEFWDARGFEYGMYSGVSEYADREWCYKPIYRESRSYDRYEAMMSSFASYVRGEAQNPFTPEYELTLYKTILECCNKEGNKNESNTCGKEQRTHLVGCAEPNSRQR